MSVSTLIRIATGTGNGATTAFNFSFKILAQTDLKVYLEDSAGSDDFTLQTLTTHYTVSFDTDAETGTVTFVTAPGSGKDVVIVRDTAKTQGSSIPREAVLPAATLETALDKLTIMVQELQETVNRAALQPVAPANPTTIKISSPTTGYYLKYRYDSGEGVWYIDPSAT